jgi:glyoxylase-like metal-dependent hydrolase (beta-lactamase superfamily II)
MGLRPPKISDPVVFADGETLDVPGRPRVLRTPGHTDGHCAIQFEWLGASSPAICFAPGIL